MKILARHVSGHVQRIDLGGALLLGDADGGVGLQAGRMGDELVFTQRRDLAVRRAVRLVSLVEFADALVEAVHVLHHAPGPVHEHLLVLLHDFRAQAGDGPVSELEVQFLEERMLLTGVQFVRFGQDVTRPVNGRDHPRILVNRRSGGVIAENGALLEQVLQFAIHPRILRGEILLRKALLHQRNGNVDGFGVVHQRLERPVLSEPGVADIGLESR